ncbi:MAG: D-lyxose/D-mannose family sugar isomerase [Acidobacteria bacterium]|nr:D-lyxose/D-mannose family sugar isomerase [Acidobacteriota bacterium]
MKRSTINARIRAAIDLFDTHRFALPPFASWSPAAWREAGTKADDIRRCRLGWDLTDFDRDDFTRCGLLLFTLRNGRATASPIEEVKPYAEKIMIVGNAQVTPWHYHLVKMEDIINRSGGRLVVDVCRADVEGRLTDDAVEVSIDGVRRSVAARGRIELSPGESITLPPRLAHQFTAVGGAVVAGEVSSLNDDETDNYFIDPVSRFPSIEEDEPAEYLLCTEYS